MCPLFNAPLWHRLNEETTQLTKIKVMENYHKETEIVPARVNIGIRISPELKEELNYEALELGLTSSQYGELILHNRHKGKAEIEQLKQTLEQRDRTIAELKLQLEGKEKLQVEVAESSKEITELKALLTKSNTGNSLLKDNRLLYLFEQLKGKKDKVENTFGDDFDIIYDSPEAVLRALIYSSKLNT